jgi:diguanylate cyclase
VRCRLERAQEKIGMLEAELVRVRALVGSDGLTGCLNRRGLEDGMERELARCDRTRSPVSITVLDVDNFKRLNDTYGHQAGDRALVHLTTVLRRALRPADLIARYGGEEFVLVLPDTGTTEAVKITNRLRRELAATPFCHQGERLDIAFSAGVAQRECGEAAQALIARADQAVYRAKRAGKNCVLRALASGGSAGVRNSCR